LPTSFNRKKKTTIPGKTTALSASLKAIYRILSRKITSWGFNVYVTDSRRTRSRYLDVPLPGGRKIIIRLSDHPSKTQWRFDYDVYTDEPRRNALNYVELTAILEKRIKPVSKKLMNERVIQKSTKGGNFAG
jgi:hypothetical protein